MHLLPLVGAALVSLAVAIGVQESQMQCVGPTETTITVTVTAEATTVTDVLVPAISENPEGFIGVPRPVGTSTSVNYMGFIGVPKPVSTSASVNNMGFIGVRPSGLNAGDMDITATATVLSTVVQYVTLEPVLYTDLPVSFVTYTLPVSFVTPGPANFVTAEPSVSTTSDFRGPYPFVVADGITSWISGQSPPATATGSLVLLATTITVSPLPYATPTPTEEQTTTVAIYVTELVTEVLTTTITDSTTTTSSLALLAHAGLSESGSAGTSFLGWNSTLSIMYQSVSSGGGSVTTPTSTVSTQVPSFTGFTGPITPHLPSSSFAARASSVATTKSKSCSEIPHANFTSFTVKRLQRRQVGTWVTATIDGDVVSWINTWDGTPPAPTLTTTSPDHPVESGLFSITAGPGSTTRAASTSILPYPLPQTASFNLPTFGSTAEPIASTDTAGAVSPSSFTEPLGIYPTSQPIASTDAAGTVSPLTTVATTTSAKNTTITSSTAAASTSSCTATAKNLGNFTINFDDLPSFGNAASSSYPPIFNPYHSLFWSNGYAYVPPPEDPYLPISPPQLAIFITNSSANVHSDNYTGPPHAGDEVNGQFGTGPNYADDAFWFNTYSAWVGCNWAGPGDCKITAYGYGYLAGSDSVVLTVEQTFYQHACPDLKDCKLKNIEFGDHFRNLTSLQLVATKEGAVGALDALTWFMDDLRVGWVNNTCAAASERGMLH